MGTVVVLAVLSTDFANAPRGLVVWRTFELVTSEHPGFTAALHESQPVRRGQKRIPSRTSMAWGSRRAARCAHEFGCGARFRGVCQVAGEPTE